jgi:aconitate hydratase
MEKSFTAPVILKMGDNISTDEILKAGAEVLPLRSNIEAISRYAYQQVSSEYYSRAQNAQNSFSGHMVVAGHNYAQGSSREHAAIAPRYLGQKAVIAKSYARIGFQNLVNYGIIPFIFNDEDDYEKIEERNIIVLKSLDEAIEKGESVLIFNQSNNKGINVHCRLSSQQRKILMAGGLINYLKSKYQDGSHA